MPVLDGHAVHEAMRQRESTLAVVFLTGHGDVPMAVEQMKRGAVDFLQKPVSAGPLQTALEHALQVSRAAFSRQRDRGLLSDAHAKGARVGATGCKRVNESGNCGRYEYCRAHG